MGSDLIESASKPPRGTPFDNLVYVHSEIDEEDCRPVTGPVQTGELFGEKQESMISLPIISKDEHSQSPTAVGSWDSTVHNSHGLNKVTGYNDRVYAVLKVGVLLKNPPGVEMFLRKRLCLKTYKRMGFGATLMKAFTRVSEWLGLCYGYC